MILGRNTITDNIRNGLAGVIGISGSASLTSNMDSILGQPQQDRSTLHQICLGTALGSSCFGVLSLGYIAMKESLKLYRSHRLAAELEDRLSQTQYIETIFAPPSTTIIRTNDVEISVSTNLPRLA